MLDPVGLSNRSRKLWIGSVLDPVGLSGRARELWTGAVLDPVGLSDRNWSCVHEVVCCGCQLQGEGKGDQDSVIVVRH